MIKNFERMTIGDRLRYLIEVRRYTQVELAKKVGVTQAAISNLVIDSSRKPSAGLVPDQLNNPTLHWGYIFCFVNFTTVI